MIKITVIHSFGNLEILTDSYLQKFIKSGQMIQDELSQAFQLIAQSNNSQIKQGQAKLIYLRKDVNYPINLLSYINNNHGLHLQLKTATQLKLWCTSYKQLESFERPHYQQVMEQVKSQFVLASLVMPKEISETLRAAVVELTDVELPQNWPTLMKDLVSYATQNHNPTSIHSVLLLIRDITKKYSILSRSDPLYEEIILVCDQTHDFLLDVTVKIIQSQSKDHGTMEILETLLNIFYHLNYHDLHPKFEDNANNWISILKQIMGFANEDQAIFKCKGAAFQSILLYANKYKEDVEESIQGFSKEIWDLCSNATDDPGYSTIVFNCLKYFKSYILLMQEEDLWQFTQYKLIEMFQKLIMPNLKIRQEDIHEKLFKGQIPLKRSATFDLLRVMYYRIPNLESSVTNLIKESFPEMIKPAFLQSQCDFLNFIIDASNKTFSHVDGCTDTYIKEAVIVQCFEHIVHSHLYEIYKWVVQNPTKMIEDEINFPAFYTILRFCLIFRIYIPTDNYRAIIEMAAVINTNSKPIKTLLFRTINAFITVRDGDFVHFRNFKPHFNSQNLSLLTDQILNTIHNDKNEELNYDLTKMFFHLAKTLGQGSIQYYDKFQYIIIQMLMKAKQSRYNSVLPLFEAIGVIAFHVSKKNGQEKVYLENHIHKFLNEVIQGIQNDNHLIHFSVQILSICIMFSPKYLDRDDIMFSWIIEPENYVRSRLCLFQSQFSFINAYLKESEGLVIQKKTNFSNILKQLLKIEEYSIFFNFLESIVKIIGLKQFNDLGYLKVFIEGYQKVYKIKLYEKAGKLFIFKLMNNYDLKNVVQCMNSVSPNLFQNFITGSNDIIRTMQFKNDRKLMYLAVCKVISSGILSPKNEANLLSLLIENSIDKIPHSNIKKSIEGINQSQKKEGNYKKLEIFSQIQTNENDVEVDEEEELCKTYLSCQNFKRESLKEIKPEIYEKINKIMEKREIVI